LILYSKDKTAKHIFVTQKHFPFKLRDEAQQHIVSGYSFVTIYGQMISLLPKLCKTSVNTYIVVHVYMYLLNMHDIILIVDDIVMLLS